MNDILEKLKNCDGYYACPKKKTGERMGPLVGYAGTYDDNGKPKNYVSDVYYNFAKVEEHHKVLDYFASTLCTHIRKHNVQIDVLLGAPMGGILFAGALCRVLDCRVIFAEKKTIKMATSNSKEVSTIVLNRHRIKKGDRVAIVEDVVNNFSTTNKMIGLIKEAGGEAVAICCEFNRSELVVFEEQSLNLPVISLLHIPTEQYRQDDPKVSKDVETGNLILKPKDEWDKLELAMKNS